MSFTSDLAKFEVKTERQASAVIKKIVLELFIRVMKRTPVDTGNARVNWELGVDAVGNTVATATTVEGENQISQQAFLVGLGELAKFKPGQTIYITNNVNYIEYLEEGSSQQAPQGMVKITALEFQSIVSDIIKGV